MLEALHAMWQANNAINLALLAGIPDGGLAAVPLLKGGAPGRGRNVARVFGHIVEVRLSHLRKRELDTLTAPPAWGKGDTPARAELARTLAQSAEAAFLRFTNALDAGEAIHKQHPCNFLGYLIAHDSHHRGQIMLALKQNGVKISEETKWSPWTGWFKE